MSQTLEQYDRVISRCRALFAKKANDYGTAWRILRLSSLTDQLFIKAQRIRTLEEKGESRVAEDVNSEFIGLINYSIMGLIQLSLGSTLNDNMSAEEALKHYDYFSSATRALMLDKNHDYGEAWRDMRVSSITDLILMKILRIKQIENNEGKTLVSEGIDANYMDIVNYSVFALILLDEQKH